jgi:hypothetical protein
MYRILICKLSAKKKKKMMQMLAHLFFYVDIFYLTRCEAESI